MPKPTINATFCCYQFDTLQSTFVAKKLTLSIGTLLNLNHDNVRSHSAVIICQKVKSIIWKILHHPTYSPDLSTY